MKDILIGIDIGTSACKAAAFLRDGTVLCSTQQEYEVSYPRPGWAEQDPQQWWEAVCLCLKRLCLQVDPESIRGIGIDGQSWSAIPIDEGGQVLAKTPIWMDTRAQDICDELEERLGEDRLFKISGNPLKPSYTLPKILWFKREQPSVYARAKKFLQSNSFIVYRLTGVISQDKSQGYGLSCYNMEKGQWDKQLCTEMGIDPELLPQLYDCDAVVGCVTGAASEACSVPKGVPVVAGGLDAACGTLGAGVIDQGETQEQGGQAGGMSICLNKYIAHKKLILGSHVVPGRWLLQGGTVGGGGVYNWFAKEFGLPELLRAKEEGKPSMAFAYLDELAAGVAPGSEGLIFLPYMQGERSPIWDKEAKGVFYGVDYSKSRAHFARAVLEGTAYALRHNLETAEEAGASSQLLRAMGGAANSRLWVQIKADVTGKTFSVPESDTATALGAALLAGVGTGLYKDYRQAVDETVAQKRRQEPNPENSKAYEEGYKIYLKLYESLKPIMHRKAE